MAALSIWLRALGDMACHTTDGIYAIMKPGYAATAEPITMTGPVKDQWPAGMIVKNTYRAKDGLPAFTTFWYEGKKADGKPFKPETPEEMKSEKRELPETGNLVIGTKGKMLVIGDYWETPMLIPEAGAKSSVNQTTSGTVPGHHQEFFAACKGEKPREFSQSNFAIPDSWRPTSSWATPVPAAGKKIELNEAGVITSDPKINDLALARTAQGLGPWR
jgi:hypothetical protein